MNEILGGILGGAGGGGANKVIGQIARQLGIPESMAQMAAGAPLPALTKGLAKNASKPGGLEDLLGALTGGKHAAYVDNPETVTQPEAIEDGNNILGHIFGSKDVSRNVAGQASQKTGIDAGILKQMLPMLAGSTLGTLEKQVGTQRSAPPPPQAKDTLSSLLGAASGNDDPDLEDALTLAKKFFR
jgi:hypothetical protein